VASEGDRIGLRLQLREQKAAAGDIVLLYGDESEALTHPYIAAWAKSGADLRVPAPGQAKKVAMLASLNHITHELTGAYQSDQAQQRLCGAYRANRCSLWPDGRPSEQAGRAGRRQWADPRQQSVTRSPCQPRKLGHGRMAAKIPPWTE
jgi:hypothetical protein